MAEETKLNLSNQEYDSVIFNGEKAKSFSWLINQCVLFCEDDIVIICNDKARPKKREIQKLFCLLEKGFGLVGLYRYGFFGFNKNLIKKIGWFDERFVGGGFEDVDFNLRMREADIAVYLSEEIQYLQRPSSWSYNKRKDECLRTFLKKWYFESSYTSFKRIIPKAKRLINEENYSYDLKIQNLEDNFLPFSKTEMKFEKSAYSFYERIYISNEC